MILFWSFLQCICKANMPLGLFKIAHSLNEDICKNIKDVYLKQAFVAR